MKKDLCEIVVIMDRSGSMQDVADDAVGGFNSFLQLQQIVPGEAFLTLVMFNNEHHTLINRIDIQHVKPLTKKDYVPEGTTALLDAVGFTIDTLGTRLYNTKEEDRPEKVIVAILTDGYENASREFNNAAIKNKVEHQVGVYNWNFMYLSADINAFAHAHSYGIDAGSTYTYDSTKFGTNHVYSTTLNRAVTRARTGDTTDNGAVDNTSKTSDGSN
jgi:uncharacterized protein YegL